MTACRWDQKAEDYLDDDGLPCRHDEYGDPTRHCTARRTCSQHVGAGELTCARCVARTRADLRRIPDLAAAMPEEAEVVGVTSEAANLAGPACDPEMWSWRKIAARQGKAWHLSLLEDDDEHHPYLVLGRWDLMLREDYRQPSPVPVTITNAADYLDRVLGKLAQDDGQDFPLFAREIRKCRAHMESVLRDSQAKDRGAPCPECTTEETGVGPRLVREYGHWCTDPDCDRLHYLDDSGDVWVCPRNRAHQWSHEQYEKYVGRAWQDTRELMRTVACAPSATLASDALHSSHLGCGIPGARPSCPGRLRCPRPATDVALEPSTPRPSRPAGSPSATTTTPSTVTR